MKKKQLLIFLILNVLLWACTLVSDKNEKFTMKKTDNNSNKLRLDGYYYAEQTQATDTLRNGIVLFKNGVVNNMGAFPGLILSAIDARVEDSTFISRITDSEYNFGRYQIRHDSIFIQLYRRDGGGNLSVAENSGVILNDGSFMVSASKMVRSGEVTPRDDIYRFRKAQKNIDSTLFNLD